MPERVLLTEALPVESAAAIAFSMLLAMAAR